MFEHTLRPGSRAHLGVDDDGAGLLDVGVAVDVHVADAIGMAQDRDLRVLLDVRHLQDQRHKHLRAGLADIAWHMNKHSTAADSLAIIMMETHQVAMGFARHGA